MSRFIFKGIGDMEAHKERAPRNGAYESLQKGQEDQRPATADETVANLAIPVASRDLTREMPATAGEAEAGTAMHAGGAEYPETNLKTGTMAAGPSSGDRCQATGQLLDITRTKQDVLLPMKLQTARTMEMRPSKKPGSRSVLPTLSSRAGRPHQPWQRIWRHPCSAS